MRPVKRPVFDTKYANYGSYLKPLIDSFGPFCSYCESRAKLDVEHVVPKSKNPNLALEWSNLLLGCARCNRDFKRDHNDNRDSYIWPDTSNTFDTYIYEETGRALVNEDLDKDIVNAALKLHKLVKLDDGATDQPVLNTQRKSTFNTALLTKSFYENGAVTTEDVLTFIKSSPDWSVWMTVFSDTKEIQDLLLDNNNFPGTAIEHFE